MRALAGNPIPLTTDGSGPVGAIPVTISGLEEGESPVDSVNGKTGVVVLNANDIFTSDGQNLGAIVLDLQDTVIELVSRVEALEGA